MGFVGPLPGTKKHDDAGPYSLGFRLPPPPPLRPPLVPSLVHVVDGLLRDPVLGFL